MHFYFLKLKQTHQLLTNKHNVIVAWLQQILETRLLKENNMKMRMKLEGVGE